MKTTRNDDFARNRSINFLDGGYGWAIVFASHMSLFIIGGCMRCGGVIFPKLQERFSSSATSTAWIISLPSTIRMFFGFLASALSKRFSCRTVVMIGGVILSAGMVLSAFTPNTGFLYFSYSVAGGIGRAFIFTPATVIIAQYFDKRRSTAAGISSAGIGTGTFLVPPLVEIIFKYYGYIGAFLILAAFGLHATLFGALFRPVSVNKKLLELQRDLEMVPFELKYKDTERNKSEKYEFPPTGSSDTSKSVNSRLKFVDISVLKNVQYLTFCIGMSLFTMSFMSTNIFIPPIAVQKGMSDINAAYLVSITGVSEIVGSIISGIIVDIPGVKGHRLAIFNMAQLIEGIVIVTVPFMDSFAAFAFVCGVYGFILGSYLAQQVTLVVDVLGIKRLDSAVGILTFFRGFGALVGPPFSGLLKDIYNQYDDGFYVGGVVMIIGAIIQCAGATVSCYRKEQKKNAFEI